MRRRRMSGSMVTLSVLFLCLAASLAAQSTANDASGTPDGQMPAAGSGPAWDWSVTARNRTGFRLHQPRVFQISRSVFDLKGVYQHNDNWRMVVEGRAHYDVANRLGYPRSLSLEGRQARITGTVKNVIFDLGLQQIVWGRADGLRILDVINPLDYREFILEDFLDSRRPLWAAQVQVPVKEGALQLIWIPYFAPGRFTEGEFGLGPAFAAEVVRHRFGSGLLPVGGVETRSARRPGYRLNASQFGASYSRSIGGWDLTANYFYGWEDLPNYLITIAGFPLNPRIAATPRFDRKEIVGATAVTATGPVVVRLETAWNRRKFNIAMTSPFFAELRRAGQFLGVAGADYSQGSWLWLSGQLFFEWIPGATPSLLISANNTLASLYVRGNFLNERLRPELFLITGIDERGYLIRPKVVRQLDDHWSVSLGGDFFGGPSFNYFGFFTGRDRVVLELKWMK